MIKKGIRHLMNLVYPEPLKSTENFQQIYMASVAYSSTTEECLTGNLSSHIPLVFSFHLFSPSS